MIDHLKRDTIIVYWIGWALAFIFAVYLGNSIVKATLLAFLGWFYIIFCALKAVGQIFS